MKLLVLGSGGREHALVWKIRQNPQVTEVFASPGNGGIASWATCVSLNSHQEILEFAQKHQIDLTIVGQEQYLVDGLVDLFHLHQLPVFGPSAAAARLEGSKLFAKAFMERHQIPTASYGAFQDVPTALEFLQTQMPPYVLKADGLAGGKGVVICETLSEASQSLKELLEDKILGSAGTTVVIESFLKGEEASFFVISDGIHALSFPACQDHKRVGDLDTGPNTGGMGAYGPAAVVTEAVQQKIWDQIVHPTLSGMSQEGHPYRGILYVGLMIDTEGNPSVIEYNCRFGDPECQVLMMMLKTDLVDVMQASLTGRLSHSFLEFHPGTALSVVLASRGYPHSSEKEKLICGVEPNEIMNYSSNLQVFHSGSILDGSVYRTSSGRVLCVTALENTVEQAIATAYHRIESIDWDGKVYRTDIGLKGLAHDRGGRAQTSVAILVGSKNDLSIAQKSIDIFKQFGVGYTLHVSSAHRTPERTRRLVHEAEESGIEVFIAMAGMAAHLPGVIAAETIRPVIGVPIQSSLNGSDALLSIAQMPPGVPVATVAIDGGKNAALLAIQILAVRYPDLRAKLKQFKIQMKQEVEGMSTVTTAFS